MAQKRKTGQPKLDAAETLLKKLEQDAARKAKKRLGAAGWRDNLFEVVMTRLDLAAAHKKTLAALPGLLCRQPEASPRFARLYFRAMRGMLAQAKAPAAPPHVALFSLLYADVLAVFYRDTAKDHAKTMARLDQRLKQYEQLLETLRCD